MSIYEYSPPPTCSLFMESEAEFRLIAGPVGSGKTTACIYEMFRRCCEQDPDPVTGRRSTRWAIVRQTLRQLKDTVLKDIMLYLGEVATYKVQDSTVIISCGDVYSEWLLLPMDNPEDVKRLLSSQLTGAWMSECIEMSVDVIDGIGGRLGRFPVPCTWQGIIADTNFPAEGSPWWDFMENPSPNTQIFKQPGGMEPGAENLYFLNQTKETLALPMDHPARIERGREFYRKRVQGRNQDWIRRYVHAQYGNDPSGTAVYGNSFRRDLHVVPELEVMPGRMLIVGQDFGRDPWSIIMQMDHKGCLNVLEEIPAEDIGLENHIKYALRPALFSGRYVGCPICVIGDPSGTARSSHFEINSFDLIKSMGLMAYPAPSNDLDPRLGAVEHYLLANNMKLDASLCPTVIRGLAGEYRFEKTREGVRKAVPSKKGEASHPQDALQYGALAFHGGMTGFIQGRVLRAGRVARRERSRVSAAAWT